MNLLVAFARCHGKFFAIRKMCKHYVHDISFLVLSSTVHNFIYLETIVFM